jgi:uncharacterized protein
MKRYTYKSIPLIVIFIWVILSTFAYAHRIPDATGYVSDFAGVISADEKAHLEELLLDLRETNRTEVAVVTVEYAMEGNEDFDRVGIKYFNEQGIGVEGVDNGVLVLIATMDRKIGIYPGRGLEAVLPDSLCKDIIDSYAVPKLSPGNEKWGQALVAVVEEMSPYIKGEVFADDDDDDCWGACGCFTLIWAIFAGIIFWVGYASRVRCPVCKGKVKLLKTTTVLEPTKDHSGLEKREYECKICRHKFMKSITLPAKGKKSSSGGFWGGWSSGSSGGWSSSSGGSSFGGFSGGSSGGGGSSSSF